MRIDKRAKRQAKELLALCISSTGLDEAKVRKVVETALASSQRNIRPVLRHFLRLMRMDRALRRANVESAVPLQLDVQSNMRNGLLQRYGDGLTISFIEQPSLIGGMRVQVGYDVYDGSVRAGLRALERKL